MGVKRPRFRGATFGATHLPPASSVQYVLTRFPIIVVLDEIVVLNLLGTVVVDVLLEPACFIFLSVIGLLKIVVPLLSADVVKDDGVDNFCMETSVGRAR